MVGTAGEVRMFFYGLLPMVTPVLANQQKLTLISCVDFKWDLEDL